jgi:hypothetical protein
VDLYKSSLGRFVVGNGGADVIAQPLIAGEFSQAALRSVHVRALATNNVTVYVGGSGVSAGDGYPLAAGEEVEIPVDDPSKVYVVATPASNSSQSVTLGTTQTGDTFSLTLGADTTAPIAVGATAAAVQAALVAAIGAGNCTVSGSAGGPYTVTFTGALARQDIELMVGGGIGLNNEQTITLSGGVAGDQLVLTLSGQATAALPYNATAAQVQSALEALAAVGAGNVTVTGSGPWVCEFIGSLTETAVPAITGVCGQNEQQSVSLDPSVTGGTFTLSFGGETTTAIAYNATPPAVQSALAALAVIGGGSVSVTAGTPSGWLVQFTANLENAKQALMTGSGTGLVGTVKTVTVTEVVAGDSQTVTVTATQAAQAAPAVTVAIVANASAGSQYSWLSA